MCARRSGAARCAKEIAVKRIKRIIAREGLVFLGLAVLLYLFLLAMPAIPFQFPKYKLEFENHRSYVIIISPELSQHYNKKEYVKEAFNPTSELITRRINEFIKDNNIRLRLKTAKPINSREVKFSEFVLSLFSLNFIFKIVILYAFLLLTRFIFWAIKTLKES